MRDDLSVVERHPATHHDRVIVIGHRMNCASRSAGVVFLSIGLGFAQSNSLTLSVPPGLSTIANPYNHGSNTVVELFSDVPEGTQFYTFDAPNQRWRVNQFQFGAWTSPTQTLDPGQGAFIRNPTNAISITFTGTTPTSVSIPIYQGLNLISSLPQPVSLDHMYVWDSQSHDYTPGLTYAADVGRWFPSTPPPLNQGEARLYVRGTSSASSSIYFNNYAPASGLNAYVQSTMVCLGTNLVAQLCGLPGLYDPSVPSDLFPAIGDPLPVFPAQSIFGYIDSTGETLRWLPQAGAWTFLAKFWDIRYGYPNGLNSGKSGTFQIEVPSPLYPPANLRGWVPTHIGPLSPFPILRYMPYWPFYGTLFEGQYLELYTYGGYALQWQRQVDSNSWVDIPGATSYKLEFHPLKLTDGGAYRFRADVDGCTATSGNHVLTVFQHPAFSISVTLSSSNQFRISGSAVANVSYEIESSSDLLQWTHLTTLSNAPANWEFLDTNILTHAQRFYRARALR